LVLVIFEIKGLRSGFIGSLRFTDTKAADFPLEVRDLSLDVTRVVRMCDDAPPSSRGTLTSRAPGTY